MRNTDKIKERNILQVYLNKDDALMCGNDYIGVDQLRQKAKEFIANINNAENMPEKTQKMSISLVLLLLMISM